MPLDDKDKEVIAEMLKSATTQLHTQFTEHVNGTLSPVLQRLDKVDKEQPGHFKRIASEIFTELNKGTGGAGGEGDKGKKPTNADEIEALKEQNKKLAEQFQEQTKALEKRDVESELRKHIRGDAKAPYKWFDEEEAISALLPQITKSAGGKLGINIKKQVGNAEMDEFLPLPSAVKWLADRKPHWIDSGVTGGTGATGGEAGGARKISADKIESMTFEEIQATPGLLTQLMDEGRMDFLREKKQEAALKMRAARKGGRAGGIQQRLAGRTI